MNIKILLVEDDLEVAISVVEFLELESISCDHAANGLQGLNLLQQNRYDVLILDINLPLLDGLSLCQKVRRSGNTTPILMLTARDALSDKIAGFAVGTDDYLVKPFDVEELCVRVKALAKRRSSQVTLLQLEHLTYHVDEQKAFYQGEPLKLTPITAKLVEKLLRAEQTVVSRAELIDFIWAGEQPDSNTLKVHVHYLRKELAKVNSNLTIKYITRKGFALSEQ